MDAFSGLVNLLQLSSGRKILNDPASSDEIDKLEKAFSRPFSKDLEKSYMIGNGEFSDIKDIDGSRGFVYIFGEYGMKFNSIAEIVRLINDKRELHQFIDGLTSLDVDEHFSVYPKDTVKEMHYNPLWLTFSSSTIMDSHIAIDYDPAPNGIEGQVITYGSDVGNYQLSESYNKFCQYVYQKYSEGQMHHILAGSDYDIDENGLLSEFRREHGL